MIEQQMRTLDHAQRKQRVHDLYGRSDYRFGAEVVPKLWLDN
jgi:hypothetical protein